MKIVKTVIRHGCTYSINLLGNRSFRIAYRPEGERRLRHVEQVFESVAACEEYISSIGNTDALIAQINQKTCAAKEAE